MKFFDKNPKGRILNRISNDTLTVDDELPLFFHFFLENISNCIALCLGVIINYTWVSLSVFGCFIIIFQVQKIFRASNREIKRLSSLNDAKVLNILGEVC
jgi:ABC-type multidrug transport system fused ATPase/permease subunit